MVLLIGNLTVKTWKHGLARV